MIGFHQEETEEDNRKTEFGMEFVKSDRDPYRPNINQLVEVSTQNNTYAGVYRGVTTDQSMIFSPHISFEYSSPSVIQQGGKRDLIRVEKDRPLIVNFNAVSALIPLREEAFKVLISQKKDEGLEYQI
jgi:hypothetical protein